MTLQVAAITPEIGAEVTGADLTQAADIQQIRQALWDHLVVVLRDQPKLHPTQQIEFARHFGPLHFHPAAPHLEGHPEVFVIHADEHSKVANGNGWHTDVSCDEQPPLATMLQLHTVPSSGGDTLFASMFAAFETLSPALKDILINLQAHHESEHIYRGRYADRGVDDDSKTYPRSLHPVVRTHPESGRQALYVNPSFTTRLDGFSDAESKALLRMLYAHQQRPEFQMRLQWRENTIAIWDNRCTQHFALWDYWPNVRTGHRVTIQGERPYYEAADPAHRSMRLSQARL